jgi:ABC-2 type transport system permease protein
MSLVVLKQLIGCELARLWRTPGFSIPTLVLPLILFTLFGLPHAQREIDGVAAVDYLLVSFSTFAVMSIGMFSFGVGVSSERESGWNKLIRLAPLNAGLYLASKFIVAALFALASISLLLGLAALSLKGSVSGTLVMTLLLFVWPGVVTFSALGLALGYLCRAHAASAVANIVFVPLAFTSGLFVPLESLPPVVQSIAPLLPSYHLAAMGWSWLAEGRGSAIVVGMVLLTGFTAAFTLLAQWAYHREEAKEFG